MAGACVLDRLLMSGHIEGTRSPMPPSIQQSLMQLSSLGAPDRSFSCSLASAAFASFVTAASRSAIISAISAAFERNFSTAFDLTAL